MIPKWTTIKVVDKDGRTMGIATYGWRKGETEEMFRKRVLELLARHPGSKPEKG